MLPPDELVAKFDPGLEDFEQFLLGGGSVSIWDWISFPKEWRQLLQLAGTRIRSAQAAQDAVAASGPVGLGSVLSEVDDGATARRVAVESVARRYA